MSRAIVKFPIKIFQNIVYHAKANVLLYYNIEWKPDKIYHYSYWDSVSAKIINKIKYNLNNSDWNAYASILSGYSIDLGFIATAEFERTNSNIYKNIFETVLHELFYIDDETLFPRRKENTILQFNHQFQINDIICLHNNGLYKKALASEELYNAIGIVKEIINEDKFVLSTYEVIDNNDNSSTGSSILYLSDKIPGTFTTYESIENTFYVPIGFKTGNKIIINILDSSVGDIMLDYQDNIFDQNITFFSNNDIEYVVQEVLNEA